MTIHIAMSLSIQEIMDEGKGKSERQLSEVGNWFAAQLGTSRGNLTPWETPPPHKAHRCGTSTIEDIVLPEENVSILGSSNQSLSDITIST